MFYPHRVHNFHSALQREVVILVLDTGDGVFRANAVWIGIELKQIAAYMDTYGVLEGHLVIFDRDDSKTWDEKIFTRKESLEGKIVTIVGC